MPHSKPKSKPDKPRPDFPLFCHKGSRHWAKKVRGKLHYFGKKADDPKGEAALVNHFLTHKKRLLESGELAQRTFDRYFATGGMLVSFFGRSRPVDDLLADDFQALSVTRKTAAPSTGFPASSNPRPLTVIG